MDSVTTKPERAFVEPVTVVLNAINAPLAITGTRGVDLVLAIAKEVNHSSVTEHCAIVMNLANANAK